MEARKGSSTVSVGLSTTGKDLRALLEKSGARKETAGAEKLDFLVWLADQVTYSIENGRKMQLAVGELTALLKREGAAPGEQLDAKTAISGLLALRRREISRLNYSDERASKVASGDQCFELALAGMPNQQVDSCFALAVHEEAPPPPPPQEPGGDKEDLPGCVEDEESAQLRAGANARSCSNVDAITLLPPPPPSRPPPDTPGTQPKVPVAPGRTEEAGVHEAQQKKKCCIAM